MTSISPPIIWLHLKWMEEDGNNKFVKPSLHRRELERRFLALVENESPDYNDEAGNNYYQTGLMEEIWDKVNYLK